MDDTFRSSITAPSGHKSSKRVQSGEPNLRPPCLSALSLSVCLCHDAVMRITPDIPDEAYYIAKAIARDLNHSLGRVVGDLIRRSAKGAQGASLKRSDYGFPTFRCTRPVTTEDVKSLDDAE